MRSEVHSYQISFKTTVIHGQVLLLRPAGVKVGRQRPRDLVGREEGGCDVTGQAGELCPEVTVCQVGDDVAKQVALQLVRPAAAPSAGGERG